MTTIGAQYFIDHCSEELDSLDDVGLVITRDGVPYAKVVRLGKVARPHRDLRHLKGSLKDKVALNRDYEKPEPRWDPDKYVNR